MGLLSSLTLVTGGTSGQLSVNALSQEKAVLFSAADRVNAIGSRTINSAHIELNEEEQPEYTAESDEEENDPQPDDPVYESNNTDLSGEYAEPVFFSSDFDSSFKAYMDYRCITDTGSIQYELQQQAYTDDRGFRRIGDDYCVALGTGLTDGCGERFLITLDSGYSFTAIVSDVKADMHTDSTNCYAPRGSNAGNIVEFIIDTDNADDYMLCCGSADCFADMSGNVISVQAI